MSQPCFTWHAGSGEQEQLLPLVDFLTQGMDLLSTVENSEVAISFSPEESLFRFMLVLPDQPPLTLILLCEVDPQEEFLR